MSTTTTQENPSTTTGFSFIVNRKAFTDALASIGQSLPKNHYGLDILYNVAIHANNGLSLQVTNLETFSVARIPLESCTIAEQGCLTVPYKRLTDILKTLTSEDVYFTQQDNTLCFEDSDAKGKINGLDYSEFPAEPTIQEGEITQTITLPIEALRRMITLTQYAASDDDSRPVLTGINASLKNNVFTFAGANAFILATDSETVPDSGSWDVDVLIPARTLIGLLKVLPKPTKTHPDTGNITITTVEKRSQATFATENLTVHTRLIDGTFPNYRQIIPRDMNCIAECEVSNLKRALDGIKVVAVESSSICRFTVNGHIDVEATNEIAELARAVPAQTTNDEGDVSQIIFNYTLMLAFLAAHPHGTMQLELQGSTKPGKILYPDTPGFVGVIMPMHINR